MSLWRFSLGHCGANHAKLMVLAAAGVAPLKLSQPGGVVRRRLARAVASPNDGEATLWSSTADGVDSLRQLWANVAQRLIDREHLDV
jgi:hypothetical protein